MREVHCIYRQDDYVGLCGIEFVGSCELRETSKAALDWFNTLEHHEKEHWEVVVLVAEVPDELVVGRDNEEIARQIKTGEIRSRRAKRSFGVRWGRFA